jgi:hypothetical protein
MRMLNAQYANYISSMHWVRVLGEHWQRKWSGFPVYWHLYQYTKHLNISGLSIHALSGCWESALAEEVVGAVPAGISERARCSQRRFSARCRAHTPPALGPAALADHSSNELTEEKT